MTRTATAEFRECCLDEQTITIRPIRPTDVGLETEFIERLSPATKRYRFLGGVRQLSPRLLKEFCEVDFDQSAAFVAVTVDNGKETEIGVVRYAPTSLDDVREMAITVADEWQNQGVGTLLAQRLIDFAKGQGIKELYSIDLADNTHMRQLANDLGMSARRDPDDAHQVIYSLTLLGRSWYRNRHSK